MNIYILIILICIALYATLVLFDTLPKTSNILISFVILGGIWISTAFSLHEQKVKFVKTKPILFEENIALIINENEIINCSKEFKQQFKTGDSIYIFKELDDWVIGIKWSGGDYVYKLKK